MEYTITNTAGTPHAARLRAASCAASPAEFAMPTPSQPMPSMWLEVQGGTVVADTQRASQDTSAHISTLATRVDFGAVNAGIRGYAGAKWSGPPRGVSR